MNITMAVSLVHRQVSDNSVIDEGFDRCQNKHGWWHNHPLQKGEGILKSNKCDRSKRTSFSPSVDLRCILTDPVDNHKIWYNRTEIREMKAAATRKTSQLRHSCGDINPNISFLKNEACSSDSDLRRHASTPDNCGDSIATEDNNENHNTLSEKELRKARLRRLISQADEEVYIDMNQRQRSVRRRVNYYYAVMEEQERQYSEGIRDTKSLAEASASVSEEALSCASKTAKFDSILAKVILLGIKRKRSLR